MIVELFVAGRHASVLLETSKQSLDQVPRPITMPIPGAGVLSMAARRDHGLCADLSDRVDDGIGVIPLVRDDRLGWIDRFEQGSGLRDVGLLRTCEGNAQRIAQSIGDQVDLRAPAAARSAQCLRAVFFWAPAAWRWARIAVLSTKGSMCAGNSN